MSELDSTKDLLQRWQSGDREAATEIHRRYVQRLRALVDKRIGQHLSRRFGPEDVLQSAFRTFFRRAAGGEYTIDHSADLWNLLVTITLNKIRGKAQHHLAAKRDVRREQDISLAELRPEAMAREPTHAEAQQVVEELEVLLTGLTDPEPEIVGLRLQGYSTSEIAVQVGCSRWTVRRALDRIGQRLQGRLADDSDSSIGISAPE